MRVLLTLLATISISILSWADCTSPAAVAGAMNYDSSAMKLKYCDGTNWQTFATGSSGGVPVATIVPMMAETCPSGYLVADGRAVSRTTYSSLFTAIGVMYGNGDGSTTFNLPDYRGRFLRGVDAGAGNDLEAGSRINRGDGTTGDNVGTLQADSFSSHSHGFGTLAGTTNTTGAHTHTFGVHQNQSRLSGGAGNRVQGPGSTLNPNSTTNGNHSHTFTLSSGTTANSGGSETRASNTAVYYCIRS